MQPKFMPWVDLLPEVGDPIRNERNKLAATLASAEELEKQAAALRAGVREGRAALLDRIMKQWTLHDIEQAATAAADKPVRPPDGTRATLCALAQRTMACTCSVVLGKTIAEGAGAKCLVQSLP